MKLSERIRELVKGPRTEKDVLILFADYGAEILAAVEAMEEGRMLPKKLLDYDSTIALAGAEKVAWVEIHAAPFSQAKALGPTPSAAAEAAIRQIQEGA